MRGGRADVWGPPCLPTMSSSPLFPHLSVSPLPLYYKLSSSLSCFSLSSSAVISHPSLSSSVSFSPHSFLHFSLFLQLSLQLCSVALVLLITLLIAYLILFMCTAHYVFTQILLWNKFEKYLVNFIILRIAVLWLLVHFNTPGFRVLTHVSTTGVCKHALSCCSCKKSFISLTFSHSSSLHGLLSSSIHSSPTSTSAAGVSVGCISRRSAPSPDL